MGHILLTQLDYILAKLDYTLTNLDHTPTKLDHMLTKYRCSSVYKVGQHTGKQKQWTIHEKVDLNTNKIPLGTDNLEY